jgi:DNA-binding transcriptional regulator YiaG
MLLLLISNCVIINAHIQNLWRTALSMQRRFANMKNVNRKIDYEMGRFIWSIVDKSEYSQEKWAEILNVSTRMMGYYCSGERKPTQKKLLQLIKVAGGINAEDIPF